MIMGTLPIHLTGGRVEARFLILGSLAFLGGYLSKPLKPEALRETLEAHLPNLAGAR
jgi:hypothetical protein